MVSTCRRGCDQVYVAFADCSLANMPSGSLIVLLRRDQRRRKLLSSHQDVRATFVLSSLLQTLCLRLQPGLERPRRRSGFPFWLWARWAGRVDYDHPREFASKMNAVYLEYERGCLEIFENTVNKLTDSVQKFSTP
jgi:hypothetical protein